MELKICPKGHYYNADIYDKCPECDAGEWDQDQDVEEEEILSNGMRLHFRTCPNGHRYNSDIYESCPECGLKPGTFGQPEVEYALNGDRVEYEEQLFFFDDSKNGVGGSYTRKVKRHVCARGHRYDPDIYESCPECAGKTSVKKDFEFGEDLIGIQIPPIKKPQDDQEFRFTVVDPPLLPRLVVGWLLCVDGPMRGEDFRLYEGENMIGREEGDIVIGKDKEVSRKGHAVVTFRAERNTFYVGPALGRNIIERNGEPVFSNEEVQNFDEICVGNTTLMLVAACGDRFDWQKGRKIP